MNSVPGAMDLIARNILLNQSELNRTLTPQGAAFAHNMGYSGFRRFSGKHLERDQIRGFLIG